MLTSKYKKLGAFLLAMLLLLSQPLAQVAAQQPEPLSTVDEQWITVRLTPDVSDETLRSINEIVTPRQMNVREGESLNFILRDVYGDAYPRVLSLLHKDNPEDSLSKILKGQGGPLFLPLAPFYYQNVIMPIPSGGSLRILAEQATGDTDGSTLSRVRRYTSSLKKYCARAPGCTTEELALVRSKDVVALPFASRYVSFPLKNLNKEQLRVALSRLEAARGVTDVEVHKSLRLVPNFDLSDVQDISADCVTNPSASEWPARHLALDKVSVNDLRAITLQTTVAILDTGIARDDARFTLWQNDREARGNDFADEDGNEYRDDKIGYDFVNRKSFPLNDHRKAFGSRYLNHGTHVAGLASGVFFREPPSETVKVVLDEARRIVRPMILKVAWEDGYVDNGAVIEAIQYARDMGAPVVNMSFAGPTFIKSIKREIAASPKLLFVAAAGNGDEHDLGQNLDTNDSFPAKFSKDFWNVISVGAHGEQWERPCFSNFGAETVDLVAPGVQIESTVTDGYLKTNGTSQAAPLVALAAALLHGLGLQEEPALIKQRLLTSVDFVPGLRGQMTSEGALNIAKALPFRDDLIELDDENHTLLRGRIVNPSQQIVVGDRVINFTDVKKIVSFSPEAGAVLQRVTLIGKSRLEHIYGQLTLPKIKFKEKDKEQCIEVDFNSVRDIIPATLPPTVAETCPN